jgi:hypothetical protein
MRPRFRRDYRICILSACAETLLRIATPGALTGALPIYLGGKRVFSASMVLRWK